MRGRPLSYVERGRSMLIFAPHVIAVKVTSGMVVRPPYDGRLCDVGFRRPRRPQTRRPRGPRAAPHGEIRGVRLDDLARGRRFQSGRPRLVLDHGPLCRAGRRLRGACSTRTPPRVRVSPFLQPPRRSRHAASAEGEWCWARSWTWCTTRSWTPAPMPRAGPRIRAPPLCTPSRGRPRQSAPPRALRRPSWGGARERLTAPPRRSGGAGQARLGGDCGLFRRAGQTRLIGGCGFPRRAGGARLGGDCGLPRS